MSPPTQLSFQTLKTRILSSLSVDTSAYTDASPKGSVDAGIRNSIDTINGLEGVVTTSSCAGRVSVFLEGSKRVEGSSKQLEDEMARDGGEGDGGRAQAAVPGGKGRGGRWLYVSHDTVLIPPDRGMDYFTRLFGLCPAGDEGDIPGSTGPWVRRFVRFQFEPFILHIATASLHHAKPILSAAINAGFRESGVQSLKNLDDPGAFPMVAIRTAGLALASLVGFCNDSIAESDIKVRRLVSEEYLEILVGMANERFVANRERVARFEHELFNKTGPNESWEDGDSRRERKRREGLARRGALMRGNGDEGRNDADEKDGRFP